MSQRPYQICTRCIMDTSDPGIEFDEQGICNRCRDYVLQREMLQAREQNQGQALDAIIAAIKRDGQGKDYDCVMGISGGVDSTYALYLACQMGLRPLAVHLDNGWNSELAVFNIERALKKLEVDLYTHVLKWDEFRDLQVAFLKASTPDSEIPSDHAIFALAPKMARRLGIGYIISGVNTLTEGIRVPAWSSGHLDWKYIRGIHRRFGTRRLTNYIHLTLLDQLILRYLWPVKQINLLDYVPYNKAEAQATIERELDWRPYPGKHYESIYTRFYQSYILPVKFGADKRRIHFSDLIMAGQISRGQALEEMEDPPLPADQLEEDLEYVVKKLGLTRAEFDAIMQLPPKRFLDYPSNEKSLIVQIRRAYQRRQRRRFIEAAAH